eukprot:625796-Amphidinium_carterae.1
MFNGLDICILWDFYESCRRNAATYDAWQTTYQGCPGACRGGRPRPPWLRLSRLRLSPQGRLTLGAPRGAYVKWGLRTDPFQDDASGGAE